jgi:hypothetical protein
MEPRPSRPRLPLVLVVPLVCCGSPSLAATTTFQYDVHGRLVEVRSPSGSSVVRTSIVLDDVGNRESRTISIVDTQPPHEPSFTTVAPVAWNTINLAWTAVQDQGSSDVPQYRLLRGTTEIYVGGATSFSSTGLLGNTTYRHWLSAFDSKGNATTPIFVDATTPMPPDTTGPNTPTLYQPVVAAVNVVTLDWSEVEDNPGGLGLKEYHVYRNGVDIKTVTAPESAYADLGVSLNQQYTYKVRAVDNAGNPSSFSNEQPVTVLDAWAPHRARHAHVLEHHAQQRHRLLDRRVG